MNYISGQLAKFLSFRVLFLLGLILASCSIKTKDEEVTIIDTKVKELISKMTIEEKVAQMRMFHARLGVKLDQNDSLLLSDEVKEKLDYGIGGIKNPGESISPRKAAILNNQLQKYIIENSRLGIPGFFVTESYNGVDAHGCTRFARPINMAATFNKKLVNQSYDAIGREARLRGLHLTHSPEADIVRDPRFGRMSEAFSEDTYLTTQMIIESITGMQGNYVGLKSTHIGAVAKHFAGYAQLSGGTNFASIEISPRTLIDEIFPPFEAAVKEARSLGIMASHGDINGVASHANPWLLTEVLRDQWGFEGYVVSDANDVGRLHYFMKVAETPEEAVELGLKAGVDVDLYAEDAYALLPEMARNNPDLMQYIDRSVARVLRTKFILGLFDNPYIDVDEVDEQVRSDKHLEIARNVDRESIILVKNEGVLPLNPSAKMKIALVGPLLESGDQKEFEDVVAGGNISFVQEKGFELTNREKAIPELTPAQDQLAGIKKILEVAKYADVIFAFVGGDEFTSKEGFFNGGYGDRDNIEPVGLQDELVTELKKLGKPVIIILKHRRTLAFSVFDQLADAIIDCWDLGEQGNYAIAEVLFGKVNPSGKMPVTVPRSIGQIPFHYSMKEINFKKGYLFAENTPLYPFGYGMNYSTFQYSKPVLSDTSMQLDGTIQASVTITNTGKMRGKETVQLYLKDLIGTVLRPMQELKGFEKVELEPGESTEVVFEIRPEMLSYTGLNMEENPGKGEWELRIGSSSAVFESVSFRLE